MKLVKLKNIEKNFKRDGFIHVKKIFSKKEILEVLQNIEEIKEKFKKTKYKHMHFTKDKKFNTIHNINKFVKEGKIFELSKDKRLTSIIKHIIGKNISLRNLEFFLKPKKTGKKAPIHQDNFFWNIPSKKAVNVWIACTPSNFKNGGVFYFLKSHKDGLVNHEQSFQAGTSQKISKNHLALKKYKKIYPTLSAGDCIIHHCEVIHGSNFNKSKFDRIGLVMSFKNKKAKIDKKGWVNYQKKLKINLKYLNKSIK